MKSSFGLVAMLFLGLAICGGSLLAQGGLGNGISGTIKDNDTPNPNVPIPDRDVPFRLHPTDPTKYRHRFVPPKPPAVNFAAEAVHANPPANPPLMFHELGMEVTHVKFNHAPGHTNDALNIRWTWDKELDRRGEYDATDTSADGKALRNEPACYVAGTSPVKVLVRIEAKIGSNPANWLNKATIWAEVEDPSDDNQQFMALQEREVDFENGVSKEGNSPFVEFTTAGAVPGKVGDYAIKYTFKFKNLRHKELDGTYTLTLGSDDHGADATAHFDELARMHIYSVMALPQAPWYGATVVARERERSAPWVTALAFLCYPCCCADESDIDWIGHRCGENLFDRAEYQGPGGPADDLGHGMKFDHEEIDEGRFTKANITRQKVNGVEVATAAQFDLFLTAYMARRKQKGSNPERSVNCHDQSAALTTAVQLAWGGQYNCGFLDNFGYVFTNATPRLFVGHESANNPLFNKKDRDRKNIYVSAKIVGEDDLMTEFILVPNGNSNDRQWKRSAFEEYSFVREGTGVDAWVIDCFMGPVLPKAPPFSAVTVQDFLGDTTSWHASAHRDRDTAGELKIRKGHVSSTADLDIRTAGDVRAVEIKLGG